MNFFLQIKDFLHLILQLISIEIVKKIYNHFILILKK